MAEPSNVPESTPSSPTTVGSRRKSWKRDGIFTASKTCENCGAVFRPWMKLDESGAVTAHAKPKMWARQRFCSISCSKKLNNPMHSPEAREKMRTTLKTIGHAPKIRGGNGRPLTVPQAAMLRLLGEGWVAELAIPTKEPRSNGVYPTNYKVDLGSKQLMIAIEIDGASHNGKRRELDQKKDELLSGFGWSVYRVTNAEAERLCSICTSADTLLTMLAAR